MTIDVAPNGSIEGGRHEIRLAAFFVLAFGFFGSRLVAQELGPHFRKIKDGIYVYAAKETDANSGIILTQEGVVLIDSGHNPSDSHAVLRAIKQLTSVDAAYRAVKQ